MSEYGKVVYMTFTSEQLKLNSGPGIYIFRDGDTMLYVGATKHGLGRCFSPNHKMRPYFADPNVTLTFEPMETELQAFEREEQLIVEHRPVHNVSQEDGYRRHKARSRARRRSTKRPGSVFTQEQIEQFKNGHFPSQNLGGW